MSEATGSQCEAASVLFDLPGYRVIDAVDRPGRWRQVTIASTAREAPCPACGVVSGRVHQRVRQRLADVPVAGRVEVVLVKRRFACLESLCARRTFVEVSEQVPLRARVTSRLRAVVLEAVVSAGRVVAEELLYARTRTSETQRAEAIRTWAVHYNYHRPHTAAANRPPASRLHAGVTNVTTSNR